MKLFIIILCCSIAGCISAKAKVSGTGINVQDSMHYVNVQANSINSEIELNAATAPNR